MSGIDDQIDDLYRLPLDEFTAARNALAKSLTGAAAQRVRALAKPTVVPWAINQVYWRARATYDRLLKSGERLRAAQIAALEGRASDVRLAGDANRRAIADAVAQAERIAAAARSQPGGDALARTFEALSLTPSPSESPGRLTEPLQPGGFEALAGIRLRAPDRAPRSPQSSVVSRQSSVLSHQSSVIAQPVPTGAERRKSQALERAAAEHARKREADLKKAEAAVARADAVEQETRAVWERAHDALLEARRTLSSLKAQGSTLKV